MDGTGSKSPQEPRYIEQVLQEWWKEPGSRIVLVFELGSKFTFKDVEKD